MGVTGPSHPPDSRDSSTRTMSIKRIPLSELRLGMYIHKLDGDWFQHPFWRGRFLLARWQDLENMRAAGISNIWIDTARSQAPDAMTDRAGAGEPEALPVLEAEEDLEASAASIEVLSGTAADIQPPAPPRVIVAAPGEAVTLAAEVQRARRLCLAARDQVMGMFEEARMGRAMDPEASPAAGAADRRFG